MRFAIGIMIFLLCLGIFLAGTPAQLQGALAAEEEFPEHSADPQVTAAQELFESAVQYVSAENYRRASREFRRFLKRYPRDPLAAEAQYYAALCLDRMGRYVDAFQAYQRVIERYPQNERLLDIVARQYELAGMFMDQRRYAEAKKVLEKTLLNAPFGAGADEAQFMLGKALFEMKRYHEAREEFEKLGEKYSFSPLADEALFYVGLCDFKISSRVKDYDEGLVSRAIDSLQYFRRRYPTSERVAEADSLLGKLYHVQAERLFTIGRFYYKQRKYAAALKYYEDVIQSYGQTSWAQTARPLVEKLRQQQRPE